MITLIKILATFYILLVVLQPSEWIRLFEGIPIQELALVGSLGLVALFQGDKLFDAMSSYPAKFFAYFIVISMISVVANGDGFSYAFGTIGYKYIKFYIGYIIIVVANDSPEKIRSTFFWTILSGLVVSYFCIILMLTGHGVGAGIGVTEQTLNWRGSVQWLGSFGGGNTTGLLLLFILAMSIGCFYKETARIKQLFYILATGTIGTAFIMTHSRGGFLGMLAMLGYFVFIHTKMSFKKFAPIAIVIALTILALKPQEEGRGLKESSTPERVELYHQGLQMFKHNPVFGVGSSRFKNNNRIKKTAHNIYLNTLAETGFFGFFFFIAMWFVVFKRINANLPNIDKSSLINRNVQTSFLVVAGCGVSLFFLSADHELPFIAFALLTASANQFKDEYSITSTEYKNILKIIILIILCVYVAIQLYFMI